MAILVNFEGLLNAAADVNTVKGKFNEEMTSLREIVAGTTDNDWKGPDAELFVNNTNAKIDRLNDEYTEFLEKLVSIINENHDKFKDVQQHNINSQE